jgi:hypothetical protein
MLDGLHSAFSRRTQRPPRDTILIVEASTIRDVYLLWESRHAEYPAILFKIKNALAKGPDLPDDEVKGNPHNKPRNDRFVYLLAGYLLKGGASILSIDGIPRKGRKCSSPADIVIHWNRRQMSIECKRPYDLSTLPNNVREAGGQIEHHSRHRGVAAIDCSRFARLPDTVPFGFGEEHAMTAVERYLESEVMPVIWQAASRRIVGAVAFARVPTVLRTGISPVVTPSGHPYSHALSVTVDVWMPQPRKRDGAPAARVMDAITAALKCAEA